MLVVPMSRERGPPCFLAPFFGERVAELVVRRRVRGSLRDRCPRRQPLIRIASHPPSPTKGEGEKFSHSQFVFATRGGIADVTNDVASSIARPNGVGIVMRKGTRTRVPAIGTKAISILRSVARYLITGRSGM